MEGWIKLHRKMIEWEWYDDINTKTLFLHLLLTANHQDKKWRGIEIKRGQKLTSLEHLAKETHLTLQQVRTSLNKLKSTSEITIKSTSKNTLVSIEKYSDYQDDNFENNKQITNKITNEQQTNNKQITTNNNDNNDNNDKNIYKKKFIPPTLEEIKEYAKQKNMTLNPEEFYNYFTEGNWIDSKGNKVKNWKQKMLTWNNYKQKQDKKDFQNYEQRNENTIDFNKLFIN